MTSQKATVGSKSEFVKKALDEVAPVPREASEREPEVPADIIRPSKFILGPF